MERCCLVAEKFNQRTGCYTGLYGWLLGILYVVSTIMLMGSISTPGFFVPTAVVFATATFLGLLNRWGAFARAVATEIPANIIFGTNFAMTAICLIVNATTVQANDTAVRMLVFTGANILIWFAFIDGFYTNLFVGLVYVAMADATITLTHIWRPYYIACLSAFAALGVVPMLVAPLRPKETSEELHDFFGMAVLIYLFASAVGKSTVFFFSPVKFSALQFYYYLISLVILATITCAGIGVALYYVIKSCCNGITHLQDELNGARADIEAGYEQIN